MDKTDVLFPSSFRGYSRRAVNDFILKMNGDLSKEIDDAKRYSAALEDDLDRRDARIAAMNDEICSLQAKISGLADEKSALNAELEQNKKNTSEEIGSLSEERDDLTLKVQKLTKERDELFNEIDALNADVAALNGEIKRLKDEAFENVKMRSVYHSDLDKLMNEKLSLRKELDSVNEANENLSGQIREMSEKISALTAENDRLEERIPAEVEARLNDISERMSAALREHVKRCLREVLSGADGMQSDIENLALSSRDRADKMTVSIDKFEDEMKDEVLAIMKEIRPAK